MANQIKRKYILDNAVDGTKIQLENNQALRAKKADNSDQSIFKLDDYDKLQFEITPRVDALTVFSDDDQLVNKKYVDDGITAAGGDISALQSEVDATQVGAGLGTGGAYSAPVGSNYLGSAVSLKDADSKLDVAIKAVADDVLAIQNDYGAANGLATLDGSGKIVTSQLPALAITDVYVVADIAARDALTVEEGDVAKVSDAGAGLPRTYIYKEAEGLSPAAWIEIESGSDVDSVNGYTGVVTLATSDIAESGGINLYYTPTRQAAIESYADQAELDAIASANSYTDTEVSSVQNELDATQTGAGLGTDGSYSAPVGSNYLGSAVSLKDADSKLDVAIKAEETRAIAAENSKLSLSGGAMSGNINMQGLYELQATTQLSSVAAADLSKFSLVKPQEVSTTDSTVGAAKFSRMESGKIVQVDVTNSKAVEIQSNSIGFTAEGAVSVASGSLDLSATTGITVHANNNLHQIDMTESNMQGLNRALATDPYSQVWSIESSGINNGFKAYLENQSASADSWVSITADMGFEFSKAAAEARMVRLNDNDGLTIRSNDPDSDLSGAMYGYTYTQGMSTGLDTYGFAIESVKHDNSDYQDMMIAGDVLHLNAQSGIKLSNTDWNTYDFTHYGVIDKDVNGMKIQAVGNLQLDGAAQVKVLKELHMGGNKIVNLHDGSLATDAATVGQVSAEETRALAAEGVLQGLIDALEAVSVEFVQERFVLQASDITNGYINLANLAYADSINAFVDRLAIHKEVGTPSSVNGDYTVSVVGGVTRITFINSLVTPGQEKLSAGDEIRVKYAKVAIA